MPYTYDRSPSGDKLTITRDDDGHVQLIVTSGIGEGVTVPVCIAAEDLAEVVTEMQRWGHIAPFGPRIAKALEFPHEYGYIDGAHHKQWVVDQMVRALTACPMVHVEATDVMGTPYEYDRQGESAEYLAWVGEPDDDFEGWDEGIAP